MLEWNDGHQTRLTMLELRQGCPCAACREEAARSRAGEEPSLGTASITLRRLEPVGRYAVAVAWEDGHASGIYSWDILRGLCACWACRMERSR